MYYIEKVISVMYNNTNNYKETQIMIMLTISHGIQIDKIFISVLLHSS